MSSPLISSLASTIAKAFNNLFLDATLSRTTRVAAPEPYDVGAATVTVYSCKAIHDTWDASLIAQGMVESDDVKLLILAGSLSFKPEPGDIINIRGQEFTIYPGTKGRAAVETDPAQAVWSCRAKR